jgi:hypothetical protein
MVLGDDRKAPDQFLQREDGIAYSSIPPIRMIWVTQVAALTVRETVDAPNKQLRLWQMIFLSTLGILSIFTFRKLLVGTKMLKMFILGR